MGTILTGHETPQELTLLQGSDDRWHRAVDAANAYSSTLEGGNPDEIAAAQRQATLAGCPDTSAKAPPRHVPKKQ